MCVHCSQGSFLLESITQERPESHSTEKRRDEEQTMIRHNGIVAITDILVSIVHRSIAGRYRPVRVADGPNTAAIDL